MKGFGDPVHYSVFRCNLSDKDKIELIAILTEIIKHDEDRIMIIDLGFLGSDVGRRIDLIGIHQEENNNSAIIIWFFENLSGVLVFKYLLEKQIFFRV